MNEGLLEQVRARVRDPAVGLFGPDSITWRIARQQVLGLAGGRALLLQTAHPFVAHAVARHSRYRDDPMGRGRRTFGAVNRVIFGDLETALSAARRVGRMHAKVRGRLPQAVGGYPAGTRYDADQQSGLLWVHATLVESSVTAFEAFVRPLSMQEKDGYYEEMRLFAWLFGVQDETLPANWRAFEAYNQRMWNSDQLQVDPVAREMGQYLLRTPKAWSGPLARLIAILTGGMLPPRLRAQYGVRFGAAEQITYRAACPALRGVVAASPPRVRYAPTYFNALWRLKGREGEDPRARAAQKLFYGPLLRRVSGQA